MNSDEKRDEAVTLGNLSYHLQVAGRRRCVRNCFPWANRLTRRSDGGEAKAHLTAHGVVPDADYGGLVTRSHVWWTRPGARPGRNQRCLDRDLLGVAGASLNSSRRPGARGVWSGAARAAGGRLASRMGAASPVRTLVDAVLLSRLGDSRRGVGSAGGPCPQLRIQASRGSGIPTEAGESTW